MPKDCIFLSLINIIVKHQQFRLQILVIYKVLVTFFFFSVGYIRLRMGR